MYKPGLPVTEKNRVIRRSVTTLSIVFAGLMIVVGSQNIRIAPFHALGGVVWAKNGIHFIDKIEETERTYKITAPLEVKLIEDINKLSPLCVNVTEGLCQRSIGDYATKSLFSAAIAYVPEVPDRKEMTGYCTLCVDGTFSPSCAVGRGACSYHNGVSSYNVARYRIVYGKPTKQAKDAVYSLKGMSYKDSPAYIKPEVPSLKSIVGFNN